MPLTEEEVAELVKEVGDVDWSEPFYVDWLNSNLCATQVAEKRLRAAWRFRKLMRDDPGMEQALKDLRRVRQTIKTLKGLLDGS